MRSCFLERVDVARIQCVASRARPIHSDVEIGLPEHAKDPEILDAALTRLARHGRVVICGAISQYNAEGAMRGPANYMSLLVKRARMEGFVVFDYAGRYGEAALDGRVKATFATVADFQASLPGLLARLGFAADRAAWLAERIVVDSARGAGHALGAVRREDRSHLRTRVGEAGMDYKAFNVAMHELGHNVEQVFSLDGIDNWWLAGVPNNAFTEAFAFLFQERDLEMLGLA